jgi:hypothetical protein
VRNVTRAPLAEERVGDEARSQADEPAEQWTLLPGERELSANKKRGDPAPLRGASQV